jgi:hypothetical protein
LKFPDYFGWNWDALDECLRDLSWLPPGRVILSHNDLPLASDVANVRAYVDIVSEAVQKMSKSKEHELIVLFPSSLREQIEWLLRSQQAQDEAVNRMFRQPQVFRNAHTEVYRQDMELRRVRAEADQAWRDRDLGRLIALYTSIEDDLTESEKAKLSYARQHST